MNASQRKTALGEAMADAARWRYEASRHQAALARSRREVDQIREAIRRYLDGEIDRKELRLHG